MHQIFMYTLLFFLVTSTPSSAKSSDTLIASANSPTSPRNQPSATSGNDLASEEPIDSSQKAKIDSDFFALTNQVKSNQSHAAQILHNAVTQQGMAIDSALGAVLMGMQNSDRASFDAVVSEALDMGVTIEQAKSIADTIRSSGACK